jgi:archaellum component FlaC
MKVLIIFLLLISCANGISVTCEFYNDSIWSVIGKVYYCEVASMNFSDNSTHVTEVSGIHLSEMTNSDVKMIYFSYVNCLQLNLTTIPKGFTNFFPNLIGLQINNCPITSLNGDELEDYPNLEYYVHYQTNLTRISGRFFAPTPKMKAMYFRSNKIQHVGGLLDNLEDLEYADFYTNVCINRAALSRSQLPGLIEALRQNCTDIEQDTTTTLLTTQTPTQGTFSTTQGTTSTNQPPRCEIDDLEDFVCGLDEEIGNLKETYKIMNTQVEELKADKEILSNQVESVEAKNEILEAQVEALNDQVEELKGAKEILSNQNDILTNEVEDLKDQVVDLKENVEIMKQNLLELEQMVIELYSRPCAC